MNLLWYQTLVKPAFTPSPSYFPIAWSILYILMGVAFVIILYKPPSKVKYYAINLFLIQLIFNLLWSYIFFDLQSIEYALVDLGLLLILLVITIFYYFKLSKISGILLIPYLLQVIFAMYLNIGLLLLNKM